MTTFTTEDRIKATSQHYAILSTSPKFREVLRFIEDNNLLYEAHLNRTRFWVTPEVRTVFENTLGGYCDFVPYDQNLMTGQYDNLLAGDAIMGNDKGYTVSTLEKQAEFARKRNYPL